MKIGVFVSAAGRSSGGPEVYERELIRRLAVLGSQHEYHLFCLNAGAGESLGVRAENVVHHQLASVPRAVAILAAMPPLLRRHPVDVLHSTFVPPPFGAGAKVMTLTCSSTFARPDLIPWPVRIRLRLLVHRGLRRSDMVLCPSAHVHDAARDAFRIAEDRLAVTPMGVGPQFRPMRVEEVEPVLDRLGVRRPYFFYSGRWDPRKNIVRTLEAFAAFKAQDRCGITLVLSGRKGWAAAEAERTIARRHVQDSVIHLPDTTPAELPALYSGALALIYASQWEGFGMPILEAMASGTPVVTSTVSAMPEVAGGAALLVSPSSIDEIADAMRRLVADRELRSRCIDAGLARVAQFTWEATAMKTLAAYERVAQGR